MITKEYSEGLAEVLVILDNTEPKYVNRIPEKVRNFFKENASKDYIPKFDINAEVKDMKLLDETKHILSAIYLNYWAENQEEKNHFKQILQENQKIVDKQIREKYNPDKIFENQSEASQEYASNSMSQEPVQQEESMVVYKENFFTKLISKIKKFLSIFKK